MANAAIKVTGVDRTLRALRVIDPEAMKAFRSGFKDAATPILDKAKAEVTGPPLSGWGKWGGRLDFNDRKVRTGIRSQVSVRRRDANLRLVSSNAAGAVYENAGSRNPNSQFNRALIDRHGGAPRLLVRTWKQEKGIKQMHLAVGRLIERAEARVQESMR